MSSKILPSKKIIICKELLDLPWGPTVYTFLNTFALCSKAENVQYSFTIDLIVRLQTEPVQAGYLAAF